MEHCQDEEERMRAAVLARAREHQYPLPSFGLIEDAQRCRRQVHEDRLHRRLEATMAACPALIRLKRIYNF
jgi:hypothetical protein